MTTTQRWADAWLLGMFVLVVLYLVVGTAAITLVVPVPAAVGLATTVVTLLIMALIGNVSDYLAEREGGGK